MDIERTDLRRVDDVVAKCAGEQNVGVGQRDRQTQSSCPTRLAHSAKPGMSASLSF